MTRLSLFAMSLLCLLGCALPKNWVHPTKTQQEYYADNSACHGLVGTKGQFGTWRKTTYQECMWGKGWQLGPK